ncbi:MAG: glucose-1-phosphate adenylyltransferase [Candidatus Omnitrophota bacterium]|nr:glucose-1-phosphate adenylyltransferase [Candidatus Omnitrophota bacterium]
MKRVIAIILGGGQGKRLFPLTMYRSKPAVPIGGKYRLIDIPISNCLHSGMKDIYVLTQFNSESLNNHVNNTYRFDFFSRAFVRILAAEQTIDNTNWFQGTADAVRKNLYHLDLKNDEEILILSGDHLYDMDYRELIGFHRHNRADFTVSVIPVKESDAREFGILKLGSNGRITEFKEKPGSSSELKDFKVTGKDCLVNQRVCETCYMASMGVYVFNARAIIRALEGKDADFGKEVIPHSIRKLKGFGYIFNGYWKDVVTIKSFYDVNMGVAVSKPQFSFLYNGSVFTRPRFLPSARVHKSRIEHSIITEGSVLYDAHIENSIVGLRSTIGRGCRITRTVVMGADYFEDPNRNEQIKIGIADGSNIDRAIIDKNARIGRNVVIRNSKKLKNFDGENYFIRDGIVIIPKNAIIKDETRI